MFCTFIYINSVPVANYCS